MKSSIIITGLAACLCTAALADLPADRPSRPELVATQPQLILPKRVARYTAEGRIGKWTDYGDGGISQDCGSELIFDSFEPGGAGPGCRQYGVDCTADIACGSRWYFGPGYCNTLTLNDIFSMKPGSEGTLSERLEFAWYQDPSMGPGTIAESLLIVITTFEDMELSCTSPIAANGYGGVILDFGLVDEPEGYYYTDANLCNFGLDLQTPVDGNGGWLVIQAQEQVGTAFIASTCNQPMLWGTKSPLDAIPGTAPYRQTGTQYDDDGPRDGVLDPFGECYTYLGTVPCPDPVGAMLALYRANPCADFVLGDANCSGTVDAEDIDPFFIGLGDAGIWADMFPLCDFLCALDVNESGGVDAEDVDPFFVCVGMGFCP